MDDRLISLEVLQCIRDLVLSAPGDDDDGAEERNGFEDEVVVDAVKIHMLKSATISGWSTPSLHDQRQVVNDHRCMMQERMQKCTSWIPGIVSHNELHLRIHTAMARRCSRTR